MQKKACNKKTVKKQRLFNPDAIATSIASAICRDLGSPHMFDQGEPDWRSEYTVRQCANILKRYTSTTVDVKSLHRAAFRKFEECNVRMGKSNFEIMHIFKSYHHDLWESFFETRMRAPCTRENRCILTGGYDHSDLHNAGRVLESARLLIKQVLGIFSTDEFLVHCKNGSGSTLDVPFKDVSLERKFTYPITCTAPAGALFTSYLDRNYLFREVLDRFNEARDPSWIERLEVVEHSRATTVDKTNDVRRMIAVEPTANMFLQQGLMEMFYERLRQFGLDVTSLPARHRELARESSLTHYNATIDFHAASDSVGYELVKRLLPPDWFRLVDTCRTPSMELDDGVFVDLNMFSTMGNAVTFPLETLIFWAIGSAVCHHMSGSSGMLIEHKHYSSVSVFGDDCILPTHHAEAFINFSEMFGFIVNKEKSFFGEFDNFRESCGGDFFRGFDVRPYSFKAPRNRKMSNLAPWLYTILNNILPKYNTYFGCYANVIGSELFQTALLLLRENDIFVRIVPSDFPDDAGLHVPYVMSDFRTLSCDIQEVAAYLKLYDIPFSDIRVTEQGVALFQFHKFKYKKNTRIDEELRYAVVLPLLEVRNRQWNMEFARRTGTFYINKLLFDGDSAKSFTKTPDRRLGGYVVAKGASSVFRQVDTYEFSKLIKVGPPYKRTSLWCLLEDTEF